MTHNKFRGLAVIAICLGLVWFGHVEAALSEGSVSPVILSEPSQSLSLPAINKQNTNYDSLKFSVKSDYLDEADLSNGKKVYKVYEEPRLIYTDSNGIKKQRPSNWSVFHDEKINARLKKNATGPYNFKMDFDAGSITITGGNLENINAKSIVIGKGKNFSQKKGSVAVYTNFTDYFDNIDINFTDFANSRSKEIIIKKQPFGLNKNESLIFWDSIVVPTGAKVYVGGKELFNEVMSKDVVDIRLADENTMSITPAVMFDNKNPDTDYRENAAIYLNQIVRISSDGRSLMIGLVVESNFLMDSNVVYPVTIDPTYNVCKSGGGSCVQNFYLRYLTSQDITNANLFMGYDMIAATGDPCGPPSGAASRHAVLKFNLNEIPSGQTITMAKLRMYYAGPAVCAPNNYSGAVSMRPKQINTYWTNSTTLAYSSIQGALTFAGDPLDVNTATAVNTLHEWNIYTTTVQGWKDGTLSNNGLLVEPAENWTSGPTPPYSWTSKERNFKFYSTRYATSSKWPYLYVESTPTLPDLTDNLTTFTPQTITAGQNLSITFRTKNSSTVSVGQTSVIKYYFNPLATCYNTSNAKGQVTVPNLSPNGVDAQTVNYLVPSNLSGGQYCLYYIIDANNAVSESNEGNNSWQGANPITVNTLTVIDLTRSTDSISSYTYSPGDTISASATIINNGNSSAAGSTFSYYFTKDSVSYSSAKGSSSIPALSSGSTSYKTITYTIPPDTAAGTYYLSYFIDSGNAVTESNEGNNQYYFSSITVSGRPDLTVTSASINDTSLHYSDYYPTAQTLSIITQVRNLGTVSASGVTFKAELVNASNSSLTYPLTNLSASASSFSAGYNSSVTLTGTIPSGMPYVGTYYIRVTIDSNLAITESNETNNQVNSGNTLFVMQYNYSGGGGGGGSSTPAPDTDNDGLNDLAEIICGTAVTASDRTHCYSQFPSPLYSKPTDKENVGADPVNLRNGALELEAPDFKVTNGPGFKIDYTRTYNSKLFDRNARLGRGWSHSYNIYYYQDPSSLNIQVYLGGAQSSVFTTSDGGTTFVSPKGETETFYKEGGNFIYKTLEGIKYSFSVNTVNNISMVNTIADTNSNTLTFGYSNPDVTRGVPLLTTVTDSAGRVLSFVYPADTTTSTWDKVLEVHESMSGADRLIAKYNYNVIDATSIDLVSVTNFTHFEGVSQSALNNYVYASDGKLLTYTNASGTILYNDYDSEGKVLKQYEKNPRLGPSDKRLIYEISYTTTADPVAPGSTHCTLLKNYRALNDNYNEKLCFNSDELRIYRERGSNVERWTYDGNGMPSAYTDALGNTTTYTYDTKRRLTQTVLPDSSWHNVIVNTYENTFNKLTSKKETATKLSDSTVLERTASFLYDAYGNIVTSTDYLNKSDVYTYDAKGNVLTAKDRNGQVTNYQYTANGYRKREDTTVLSVDGVTSQTIIKLFGYDGYGNVTSSTDPRGYVSTYAYDSRGHLRREIDPNNKTLNYHFDANGHKDWQSDKLGHVTRFVYDTDINSSLMSVTQESSITGNIVNRREYDWLGTVKKEIDPNSAETIYNYDSANRLLSKSDSLKTVTYAYYANGLTLSETVTANSNPGVAIKKTMYFYDVRGNKIEERRYIDASTYISLKWEYDGLGRVVKQIDGNNNATKFSYDYNDQLYSTVDARGNTSTVYYDNVGNKISELNPRGYSDGNLRNSYGKSISYFYDGANRLIKVTDANNKVSENYYDASGNLIKSIDRKNSDGSAGNHIAQFTYDNLNRKTVEIYADNSSSTYTYFDSGLIKSKTDPMGLTTQFIYDDFNRLTSETAPGNIVTGYKYDSRNNKIEIDYPDTTKTIYGYDNLNRLHTVTDASSSVRIFNYDEMGNRTSEVNKLGYSNSYGYDQLGRLTTETNAQGTVTSYIYDDNNNQLSVTVGVTKTTSYQYDELNHVKQITYPGNKTEKWTYDANGNQATYTDGNNVITTLDYDQLDRMTTKHLTGGVDISYTYDNWNNLTHLSDESGVTDYVYDTLNRVSSESKLLLGLNTISTISKTYQKDGQLKTLTDAGGRVLTYNYNNRGLLDNISYLGNTLASYTYSPLGKPLKTTFGNGVTTDYVYDNLNRVKSIETKGSTSTLFKEEYQYDAESNRTSVRSLNGRTIQYGYDNLGQLTGVDYTNISSSTDITYTYDIWGNRTMVSSTSGITNYAYTANTNELSQYANNLLTVDTVNNSNGALSSETYKKAGQNVLTASYSWDKQNRLSGINYHYTDQTLQTRNDNNLAYVYDDFGNRVKKTVNGASTYYFNYGLSVLNEITASGTVSKLMVYGIDPIAEIFVSGTIQYIHTDVLGSTVLVTNSTGQTVAEYEYEPFGATMGYAGTYDTNYLFTGQEFDPESELYYYNARYYNPTLGRFISRDKSSGRFGDSLTRNGYIYVMNNPLKYTDPTGNEEQEANFYDWVNYILGIDTAYASSDESQMCIANSDYYSDSFDWQGLLIGNGMINTVRAPISIMPGYTWSLNKHPLWEKNSTAAIQIYNNAKPKGGNRLDFHPFDSNSPAEWHLNLEKRSQFNPTKYDPHIKVGLGGELLGYAAKAEKTLGVGGLVVGAAVDGYSIYTSDNKVKETARVVGGWSGSYAGATVGASYGATWGAGIGAAVGPVGFVVGGMAGGFIGGIAGGVVGYLAGANAGESIYNSLSQ
ncbi:MAG: CARDB domain-containing protein [Candidatus Magasanikbacteria bacterium]|jgi:RHS repeat-associated protein